jgi:hypothetical protein
MGPGNFLKGMNRTTSLALTGGLVLALSFLTDVYGDAWGLGAGQTDLVLALAAGGALLVLASIVLDRRSTKNRR